MLAYRKVGSCYQVEDRYEIRTELKLDRSGFSDRVRISSDGVLTIGEGYAWDGPSGPTFDRETTLRASCIHDALYHLIRRGQINFEYWRECDRVMGRVMKEDGAWKITRTTYMAGLRLANGRAAKSKSKTYYCGVKRDS